MIMLQLYDVRLSNDDNDDQLHGKIIPQNEIVGRSAIQMRGNVNNCQSGRDSNSHARIMKTIRTDLKRKRCPMAVINSTVASNTVIRTYWSPVSPDFVP